MYHRLGCISNEVLTTAALTTLIATSILVLVTGSLGLSGYDTRPWACTAMSFSIVAFLLFLYIAAARKRGLVMHLWLGAVALMFSLTTTEVAGIRHNIGVEACDIATSSLVLLYIAVLRVLDQYHIISWNKWVMPLGS